MARPMRSTAAAFAALVATAGAASAAPAYNWSGVYIGTTSGYASGTSVHSDAVIEANKTDPFAITGAIFGAEAGFNWQASSNWVFGVSADYVAGEIGGHSDADSSGDFGCGVVHACYTTIHSLGTVRARFGYAFDRSLIYATGGYAFGSVTAEIRNPLYSGKQIEGGWVAGAGLEHAFTPNWTGRLEVLHVDLGTFAYYPLIDAEATTNATLLRIGLSYKFGGQD